MHNVEVVLEVWFCGCASDAAILRASKWEVVEGILVGRNGRCALQQALQRCGGALSPPNRRRLERTCPNRQKLMPRWL
jgi:hypothetical protein